MPEAPGIRFTADPVTSNRKVASVEASFGLGEARGSGLVNADVYKVRDGEVVAKAVAAKQLAIHASPAGGTKEEPSELERQEEPALTDAQVGRLAQLGRRIEEHFGHPQDIEWCLVDDDFQVVQTRPITTLFPIPAASDRDNHVYVSVGHQQMMTDPMKPLGLSLWQLTAMRPMYVAGGRLFVDVTQGLASPASRAGLLEVLGKSDPLIRDALQTVLDRGDFIRSLPDEGPGGPPAGGAPAPIETDPAIVAGLIGRSQASIAALKRDIRAFLDKYGMRCVGEIDITRPRWSERPITLVPVILGNIKNFEPGAGERRFEQGRREAWEKEQELLERLRALPDGERKAEETKRMTDRVRTFIRYRE